MKTIQNFNVLPIRFSATSTSPHELYCKENTTRASDDTQPVGKTLFILNVPPYADEKSLKHVFAKGGKVRNVTLYTNKSDKKEHHNCGFKHGYVVFDKREGMVKALKLNSLEPLSTEKQPIETGIRKWAKEYNNSVEDHEKLNEEIEKYMAEYDRKEAEEKAKENETDEDGWTLVTKKGRNPGVSRSKSKRWAKAKSKKKELKNFYTFQIREQKLTMVEELRKKYESDKAKVEAMRKLRKFKPY